MVNSSRPQVPHEKDQAVSHWAKAMCQPEVAVILDTETTALHGYIIEIAIIDASTGGVLLNTLVNPETPIQTRATKIHGITDADVARSPRWSEVLPEALSATQNKIVIAYNSMFDFTTIIRHSQRDGLSPAHLGDSHQWECLMTRRCGGSSRQWLPLGGSHRALGDCHSAYTLLHSMAIN